MAQRLCFEERPQIEAMVLEGHSWARVAQRLRSGRSTVWRELRRNRGSSGYRAAAAQAAADARACRPRAAKSASGAGLARAVAERLGQRWSPHAISAETILREYSLLEPEDIQACLLYAHRSIVGEDVHERMPVSGL